MAEHYYFIPYLLLAFIIAYYLISNSLSKSHLVSFFDIFQIFCIKVFEFCNLVYICCFFVDFNV